MAHCPGKWSAAGLLVFTGCLLSTCSPVLPVNPSSVTLSPDQQALVITSGDPVIPDRFTLKHLPTESAIAPGLYFRPKRFGLVRVSPDGRLAAFSTVDHHTLVGLLDLATMATREIDVITEGEVLTFHWAPDGHLFVYDYLPANGYHRVRGYDVQSGERLVVPRTEHRVSSHLTFEQWGSQPREVIVGMREQHSDEPRTITVNLIASTQLAPLPKPRQ
jgi:WD40 repeat protein